MKKKYYAVTAILSAFLLFSSFGSSGSKIGVVDFKACVEGSKLGKAERSRFEEMQKKLESTIQAKEKELNALSPKFSEEYLDTLTPEAENELKQKFQSLNQELGQLQNQYYQVLNQANMEIVQTLTDKVSKAAEAVAKAKGYDFALNKEGCFYFKDEYDLSKEVITELDSRFEKEGTK